MWCPREDVEMSGDAFDYDAFRKGMLLALTRLAMLPSIWVSHNSPQDSQLFGAGHEIHIIPEPGSLV